MFKYIDDLLNRVTMYRLVLYFLTALLFAAAVLSLFNLLPFSLPALAYSTLILLAVSWVSNKIFAKFLGVETNVDSVYITAFILALIISPPAHGAYLAQLPFYFWAAVLAMASKYILNFNKKHIFNPAALAVAVTSFTMHQSASWWVGTPSILPFVAVGGLLMVRKVRKINLAIAFFAAFGITIIAGVYLTAGQSDFGSILSSAFTTINKSILYAPLLFFGSVMLTEPLTMPPTRDGRIAYGLLAGWLFAPQTHLGSFYSTPELALLVVNVFSYIISPKSRYILTLIKKEKVGDGIFNFVFQKDKPMQFKPGQYMEWTLGHAHPDSRGNRRYFTIASSPTEPNIILGVRFYKDPSSFKKKLALLNAGDTIAAGQLAGDFTLPSNPKEKIVFIAGGIGITPFRSMLKYLIDVGERRDIIVLYANANQDEIAYSDILYDAAEKLGVKTIGALSGQALPEWEGYRGYFTPEIIQKEVPDLNARTFYISGSNRVVDAFSKSLRSLGVRRSKIKTDFFSGLA